MRRVVVVTILALLLATALCVLLAEPVFRLVDASVNRLTGTAADSVSVQAAQLHGRLWVSDLHCDAAYWDRGLVVRSTRGHADLPRLREGRVALQVFSFPNAFPLCANYTRTPAFPDILGVAAAAQHWPRATWTSPLARALHQARIVHEAAVASNGSLVVVTSVRSLAGVSAMRAEDPFPIAAILAVEGIHVDGGDLRALDYLFLTGVRVFGLAHMSDNSIAGSAHGWRKYGLTAFGRQAVAHIDSLGGIVDLAHASDATIDEVLALSTRPVLVSHTGVDGTCEGPRNLSDDQLRKIAARGGIVGIGFWDGAVCGDDARAIARAIRHAVDVAGVDAVALGSDFDGGVQTPFDAAGLAYLTEGLLAEDFSAEEIARVMGINALGFFLRALPPE